MIYTYIIDRLKNLMLLKNNVKDTGEKPMRICELFTIKALQNIFILTGLLQYYYNINSSIYIILLYFLRKYSNFL